MCALFVAKKPGRDRVVIYDPLTLESLLASLDTEDPRGSEELSAVLLLAETLDLRDTGMPSWPFSIPAESPLGCGP